MWQEVFKEELQNRSSERSPFDEGKSYDAFRPEERVSDLLTSMLGCCVNQRCGCLVWWPLEVLILIS